MSTKKGQVSYVRGYKYCHYQACLSSPVFGRQPYHGPSTTIHVQNTPAASTVHSQSQTPGSRYDCTCIFVHNPNHLHQLSLG